MALRFAVAPLFTVCLLAGCVVGQSAPFDRRELAALTKFRQQHRRTLEGHLCAAAFVQNRKVYTGCTEAADPLGESGRPWCYVEAQVAASSDAKKWGVCGPVQDYGALRAEAQAALRAEAAQARASVAKLNKAHAAAVQTLDMYRKSC